MWRGLGSYSALNAFIDSEDSKMQLVTYGLSICLFL